MRFSEKEKSHEHEERCAAIIACLTAILLFSPLTGFAQSATSFSGEAVALRVNALGISLSAADTGPLPSTSGNLSTSLAKVNVLGVASADALTSTASGSGTSSQSESRVANLSLLGGLITANVVDSTSSATCSGSTASTSGNVDIVGLVAAGQRIAVSNPNLAISLPGGISLVVNEQTSSSGGNSGSITVNALHVKGPSIDIMSPLPSPVSLVNDNFERRAWCSNHALRSWKNSLPVLIVTDYFFYTLAFVVSALWMPAFLGRFAKLPPVTVENCDALHRGHIRRPASEFLER